MPEPVVTSHATYKLRRHRRTGELLILRFVHGRPTGTAVVNWTPAAALDFDDSATKIADALGAEFEDEEAWP